MAAFDASFWRDRRVFITGHTGFKGAWLTLWLDALGYQVTTIEGGQYEVPRNTDTVLILAPTESVRRDEAATLEQWTRGGGRLVVADASVRTDGLLRRFGVNLRPLLDPIEAIVPAPDGRLDPAIQVLPIPASSAQVLSAQMTAEVIARRDAGAVPLLVAVPRSPDGAEARSANQPAQEPGEPSRIPLPPRADRGRKGSDLGISTLACSELDRRQFPVIRLSPLRRRRSED